MKKILFYLLIMCSIVFSQKLVQEISKSAEPMVYQWKQFDGNRINATINSAGPYADYLKTNSSGLEWPKGSGKTAIFTAGIWLIGKHRPSDSLRTAVMNYASEYQPGPILSQFNTTTNDPSVAANPSDNKYRIYKINKGDTESSNIDYAEWPGDLGAPFVDVNNNGVWDSGIDLPQIWGDQTLWSVYNDLNPESHSFVGVTKQMGLEIQAIYFGFDRSPNFQDVMFMRWRIVNKSDADYDSVYISMWSDIDLGDANDDVSACDTSLSLLYVYNGDEYDAGESGYGTPPPAAGFVFLQGPMVPGQPGEVGLSGGKTYPGFKNLPGTSHAVFFGGGGSVGWSDPSLGNPDFARQAYNYQKGLVGFTGSPFIDPQTNIPSKFVFPGDPVSNTGWTQSVSNINPGDVRSMISSGPFTLAKGDTQEIVGAFVIAKGVSRLHSITALRGAVDFTHKMYKNIFRLPLESVSHLSTNGNTGTITVHADVRNLGVKSITAIVKKIIVDSTVAQQLMKDDGLNGDSTANDNIYFASFTVSPTAYPYQLMFISEDTAGTIQEWQEWNVYHQFASIQPNKTVIFSDHLNNNGIAEKGENIRFGLEFTNPNSFSLNEIIITPISSEITGRAFLSEILPHSNAVTPSHSYFTVQIPATFSAATIELSFLLQDRNGNQWKTNFSLPIHSVKTAELYRISGKGIFSFDVVITDSTKIKNHLYVLTAEDSLRFPAYAAPYIVLKDLITKLTLSKIFTPDTSLASLHAAQSVDGFKIIPKKYVYNPVVTYVHTSDAHRWYNIFATFDVFKSKSTHHFGDLSNVSMRFSKKTGFVDSNNNGLYDIDERVLFDTTNSERTQKVYLYQKDSFIAPTVRYIGFIDVPFSVYDTDVNPPKKLTVAIVKRDTTAWLNFYSDIYAFYILSDPYQDDGSQYSDSLSGGFKLHSAVKSGSPIPYYYTLSLTPRIGMEILLDTVSTEIIYSHPITSQDMFVFNPVHVTSVKRIDAVAATYRLEQNFPNPFNPATTIRYTIPVKSKVTLTVYNILGQRITTLVNDIQDEGHHSIFWNGRNDQGAIVASGLYIYHITAGNFSKSLKMMLLK